MEITRQGEIIIPEWLFREAIDNKLKKIYNHIPLRQIAGDNFKLNDEELNKELAKKMINPYYFTDRALQVGLNINLDSHHINHANCKITITPKYCRIGIEARCVNELLIEMAAFYVRFINQYKLKYQRVLST